MTCQAVLLIALLAAPATGETPGRVLDAFSCSNTQPTAWVASESTPKLRPCDAADERNGQLAIDVPFGTTPTLQRVVIDRFLNGDDEATRDAIAHADEFTVRVHAEDPSAYGHVTLYFHTGDGWLGCSGSIRQAGWNTLTFKPNDFRAEGSPGAWADVDRVRLAFWRAKPVDTTLVLKDFRVEQHRVALLAPDNDGGAEARSALSTVSLVRKLLDASGISSGTITPKSIDRLSVETRPLLIVPYMPRWDAATTDAVIEYVEDGGKVFVSYTCPEKLLNVLGFANPKYVKPEKGTLHSIWLGDAKIEGVPLRIEQDSWNITAVEPAAHGARIIGWWLDDREIDTLYPANHEMHMPYPAMLVSDRGAFFTHILLPGDPENKKAFLEAVCGHFVPDVWRDIALAEAESWKDVGSTLAFGDAWEYVKGHGPDSLDMLEHRALATEALAVENYPDAVRHYRVARELLREAFLRALPSRSGEARAWWNHSGTGPYPGDWDRAMEELSSNGFNMVLPNMLWGGLAHYPSDLLPRSSTLAEHGDQVAQCVAAGKRHGVEVHVWKVNYNMSNAPRAFVEKMRSEGRTQVTFSGEQENWLCPSHPANLELEVASMLEVARMYDVDGLHFDYIRYPGSNNCFCDGCRERFETSQGRAVANWPTDCKSGPLKEAWTQWRCDRITELVRRVSVEARELRPELKISAAVFGSYPDCRSSVAQDWPVWIERGYLDFICPMDYTESDHAFQGLVENQMRLTEGRIPVYPGIGVTASNSRLTADRVAGQIEVARQAGAQGFTLFNLSESTADEILESLSWGSTSKPPGLPHKGERALE